MNAKLILLCAFLALPAWGQQSESVKKKYKWHHPWFNTDIVSETPPVWPYKVIEEKNGVVFVEVTPPSNTKQSTPPSTSETPKNSTTPPVRTMTADEYKEYRRQHPPESLPKIPPAHGQRAIDRNKIAEIEARCKNLGPFARLVAETKQRGVPLATAEILLLPKNMTPQAESFSKDIIRSVYKNDLTTKNAEEIIIGACQIMVSTAAKIQEVDSQTTTAKAEQLTTAHISESTFGSDWPFTVPSGMLGCKLLGNLHLVTFTANGVTYAINGTARSRLKQFDFRDSDEIWKRDPKSPEMRVSSRIVEKGLALCPP